MVRSRGISLLVPVGLLVIWEVCVQAGLLNRIFFPPPSEVLTTLAELLIDGSLLENVRITMGRIALGAMLGGVPAILIGTVMGISPIIRQLFQPLAAALYAVPKIALLPLVIVILGLGEASKVFTLAISIFFLIVLNVMASVLQVDRQYFDVAKTFGANAQAMFWGIALPGSMPGILTSLKLGMGFAFTLIVGIEFVGASSGIGWMVWHAYELYVIDRMLASLVVIAVMGWVVTALLDYAEARLVPWQRA